MLVRAMVHVGCTDTVRVSTGRLCEKNPLPHLGLEPASVLHLAFRSDAVPTELSPPLYISGLRNSSYLCAIECHGWGPLKLGGLQAPHQKSLPPLLKWYQLMRLYNTVRVLNVRCRLLRIQTPGTGLQYPSSNHCHNSLRHGSGGEWGAGIAQWLERRTRD